MCMILGINKDHHIFPCLNDNYIRIMENNADLSDNGDNVDDRDNLHNNILRYYTSLG